MRALQDWHEYMPLLSETCPSDAVSGISAGSDDAADEDPIVPDVVLDDDVFDSSPSSLTVFHTGFMVEGPSFVFTA